MTVVAVLLLISAVVGIISGIGGLVGAANGTTAVVEGQALNQYGVGILSGSFLVIGIVSLLLAIGILRGSRVARLLVTILQILTVIAGLVTIFQGGANWSLITNLGLAVAIVSVLWSGEKTKAFFARS